MLPLNDIEGPENPCCRKPDFIETFRELGANPVNMNWSEATTGFQQGVVDGQENPTNGINIPLKIWDYHKNHSDWHYIIDPLLMGINPKVWESFSPEDQKLLIECAKEAENMARPFPALEWMTARALNTCKASIWCRK